MMRAEEPAQVAAGEKEEEHTDPMEYGLMVLSVGAAVVGLGLAHRSYARAGKDYSEPIAVASPPLYTVLSTNIMSTRATTTSLPAGASWADVRLGVMGLGEASSWFDSNDHRRRGQRRRLDHARRRQLSSWWDKWIIDGVGVNGPAILARMLSYPARLFEWGLVQWYALVMVAGLVGFVFYYVWK